MNEVCRGMMTRYGSYRKIRRMLPQRPCFPQYIICFGFVVVRRKRESKKRNQNCNRDSLITTGILGQPRREKPKEKYVLVWFIDYKEKNQVWGRDPVQSAGNNARNTFWDRAEWAVSIWFAG